MLGRLRRLEVVIAGQGVEVPITDLSVDIAKLRLEVAGADVEGTFAEFALEIAVAEFGSFGRCSA